MLGVAIAASGGSIEFSVTFKEIGEYSIQFVFTLVPPTIKDDDGFISSTNATALIDFAIDNIDYGLNADTDKHAFAFWCTITKMNFQMVQRYLDRQVEVDEGVKFFYINSV